MYLASANSKSRLVCCCDGEFITLRASLDQPVASVIEWSDRGCSGRWPMSLCRESDGYRREKETERERERETETERERGDAIEA